MKSLIPGSWRLARTLARQIVAVWAVGSCASAQSPPPRPPNAARAVEKLEQYRKGRTRIYMDDYGELNRYRAANATLPAPAAGEARVVFFGDSITDAWHLPAFFPGKPYVNRGIGGQTTSQMLVRFRADVVNLRPAVVVILAGTNDIAGNSGPMSLDETEGNYASMADLARAAGIRVVFSSVIPVHNYTPESELTFPLRPLEKIRALNRWLQATCASQGLVYLDYASAMTDAKGMLRKELAPDGLHPNQAGFAIMAPLAAAAIRTALPR